MDSLLDKGHLLDHDHTRQWFREELYFPARSFARQAGLDQAAAGSGAHSRANAIVSDLLGDHPTPVLDDMTMRELRAIISADFKKLGAPMPPLEPQTRQRAD
jgi:trimethylamine:corrinoid methyltransferase-like protein